MKLTVTSFDAERREASDHAVEYTGEQTLGGLARSIGLFSAGGYAVDGASASAETPLHDLRLLNGSVITADDAGQASAPPQQAGLPSVSPESLREIRLAGGLGAGRAVVLGPGRSLLGEAAECSLGAGLGLPEVAVVVDISEDGTASVSPGSEQCRLFVDDVPVSERTQWPLGAIVNAGGIPFQLVEATAEKAHLVPSAEDPSVLDHNRPPRLLPETRERRFRMPNEVQNDRTSPLPYIAAFLPVLMAAAMFIVMRNPMYLMFAVFSPIMLIGNWWQQRKLGKERQSDRRRKHEREKAAVEEAVQEAVAQDRALARHSSPDPAEISRIATLPTTRLWERRRTHDDHLSIRFGLHRAISTVAVEDPQRPDHERKVEQGMEDVPATLSLASAGVIGVAAEPGIMPSLSGWIAAQLATLQSPRDVQICLLTSQSLEDWEWARWLPHLRPAFGQDAHALIASDAATASRRISELAQLVSERLRSMSSSGTGETLLNEPDVVVIISGARRLRALPGLTSILQNGPAARVFCLCLDAEERLLPEECQATAVQRGAFLEVRATGEKASANVLPDLPDPEWFPRVARSLASVRDASPDDDDAVLPASARLLDLLQLEPPTGESIAQIWKSGGRSTSAVLGAGVDGAFSLDLRTDGPHGLVAGTTGSGKSELLQTLVASLAVVNTPESMNFVLVDYKGGAAFKDCVDLPHTVGMVTDLDTHLVERALESLGAELTRREHMLAAVGAKDIEDYTLLQDRGDRIPAMPRLLIVIDEFASLARELPDFVKGLVNIAQRGRSLGIHLVLATQRPSGVVSPEIRANTNLRIALRVTDSTESQDVIDAKEASLISKSTPGRAYVRLGASQLIPFQSGRVGGRRPGQAAETAQSALFTHRLDFAEMALPSPRPPKEERPEENDLTDLAVLVSCITEAHQALGYAEPFSPWLPALPTSLLLEDIPAVRADALPADEGSEDLPLIPYGLEDFPAEQDQRPAVLDLSKTGHLLCVGAARTGRTQALRTIALSAARTLDPTQLHILALDCGNGGLLPLRDLPHAGAVVQRTETNRAIRLISKLGELIAERQEMLGARGYADITEQRRHAAPEEKLPHVLFLIDRWEGFMGSLSDVNNGRLLDNVVYMLREGASVGVHLIITGDRTLFAPRVNALVEEQIVLRLSDKTDYSSAGLTPSKMPDEIPEGRAFRAESARELQIALLEPSGQGSAAADLIRAEAAAMPPLGPETPAVQRPLAITMLPSVLTFDAALGMGEGPRPNFGLVGVGGDELDLLGMHFDASASAFIVAGSPRSGRSTVLQTMARSLLAGGTDVVLITPKSSPLRLLEEHPNVRGVIRGTEFGPEDITPFLGADQPPAVLVIDDVDLLSAQHPADEFLRKFVLHGGDNGHYLLFAGLAANLSAGFTGWRVDARRSGYGVLLSPKELAEGEAIGAKISPADVTRTVKPGRGILHLGDGEPLTVQLPLGLEEESA